MCSIAMKIARWIWIPALLIASAFSGLAGGYEPIVNIVICLGAVILVRREVGVKKYYRAAGLVAVALLFSPLVLLDKVFLLTGFTCVTTLLTLIATFRPQLVRADDAA